MEISKLTTKTKEELANYAVELKNKISTLKFDIATKNGKSVSDLRNAKKELARTLTILNQK